MRVPDIQICPIKRLYQLLAAGDKDNCVAIISSASAPDETKLDKIGYIFRQYDDLDYDLPGRSFSQKDAAAFVRFLITLDDDIDTIYCCCDAGESRSPAVAAAVCRFYGQEDSHIWLNPHYHPNMLVFDLLTRTMDMPVSDEEKDFLLYRNQKAFRDTIRGG